MPVGGALTAAIPGLLQTGGGILQSIIGGNKAKKNERALENLKTPTYTANKSIGDYYQNALQRYGVNPYQSQQYQYAQNNANAATGAGINALQDRRSAVGGVARLSAIQNNAGLRAGMAAEQQQGQRFGALGNATGMKSADDRVRFQYNDIAPYEKQYNLLAMKAAAGSKMQNSGISNAFKGLTGLSQIGGDFLNNLPFGTTKKKADTAAQTGYGYGGDE